MFKGQPWWKGKCGHIFGKARCSGEVLFISHLRVLIWVIIVLFCSSKQVLDVFLYILSFRVSTLLEKTSWAQMNPNSMLFCVLAAKLTSEQVLWNTSVKTHLACTLAQYAVPLELELPLEDVLSSLRNSYFFFPMLFSAQLNLDFYIPNENLVYPLHVPLRWIQKLWNMEAFRVSAVPEIITPHCIWRRRELGVGGGVWDPTSLKWKQSYVGFAGRVPLQTRIGIVCNNCHVICMAGLLEHLLISQQYRRAFLMQG